MMRIRIIGGGSFADQRRFSDKTGIWPSFLSVGSRFALVGQL